jgi:putative oxidoreductase
MGVAGFVYHSGDDFGSKEKAFLYFTVYIVLLILGPGKFSLDNRLRKS